jgi:hypothetical protein
MTARFEPGAKLEVVVDLAVENDLDATVLVAHWLASAFNVNDREPPMRKGDAAAIPESNAVRTAMRDPPSHTARQFGVDRKRRVGMEYAGDPTHRQ